VKPHPTRRPVVGEIVTSSANPEIKARIARVKYRRGTSSSSYTIEVEMLTGPSKGAIYMSLSKWWNFPEKPKL
jgi:hypothetical protein